jgi:hypothetical protein
MEFRIELEVFMIGVSSCESSLLPFIESIALRLPTDLRWKHYVNGVDCESESQPLNLQLVRRGQETSRSKIISYWMKSTDSFADMWYGC